MCHYLRLPPSPLSPSSSSSSRGQPLLVDLIKASAHPSSPHPSNLLSPHSHASSLSPHSPHPQSSLSPHSPHPQSPRSESLASPRSPRAQPTHWPFKPPASVSAPPSVSSSSASSASPVINKLAIPSLAMPPSQSHPPTKPASSQPQSLSLSPASSPSLSLSSHSKSQNQPTPLSSSQKSNTAPQPQSIPQPLPIPTKPEPASKLNTAANKNKEAAYLSYPEGDDDDDDIDEEIDEDLDLDGDLDFEDDEDIEIDATPQKKDTFSSKVEDKKAPAPFGSGSKSLPLSSLAKPSALLSQEGKKEPAKPPIKDRFDSDEDEDSSSLQEDMKRLEVIEQKLNLNLFKQNPTPKKDTVKTELPDDLDSIGSEDYSHSFEDDDATIDHSIESDRSSILGEYDHEEYIDRK